MRLGTFSCYQFGRKFHLFTYAQCLMPLRALVEEYPSSPARRNNRVLYAPRTADLETTRPSNIIMAIRGLFKEQQPLNVQSISGIAQYFMRTF